MIVTALLSALGVLLATFAAIKKYERVLALPFSLLFLYLALRYNFGNDYKAYHDAFFEINNFASVDYFGSYSSFEPGWVWLCRIFEPFGFFVLVATLALFSCLVYWHFFRSYIPRQFYWLAFFIYTVLPENMLTQLSAMRQAVAICFVVLAVDFVVKRKLIGFSVLVGCAALFHSSAVIFIPLYFIGQDFKVGKFFAAGFVSLYVVLFAYADIVVGHVLQYLSAAESSAVIDRYLGYEDKGSIGSGVGLAYYSMYLLSLLLAHNFLDMKGRVIVRMALLGVGLVPLVVSMAMLSRIAVYLNVFSIAAIPLVASCIKEKVIRYAYVALHIVFFCRAFFIFFEDPIFVDAYSEYLSIFSASP